VNVYPILIWTDEETICIAGKERKDEGITGGDGRRRRLTGRQSKHPGVWNMV
jgi:hypothetical protein